jgi:hypothetical protein
MILLQSSGISGIISSWITQYVSGSLQQAIFGMSILYLGIIVGVVGGFLAAKMLGPLIGYLVFFSAILILLIFFNVIPLGH